jgi:DHA3 family tetracycline resistance protein-like MFS transporter
MDWLVSVGLTPVSFALVGPAAALLGVQTTLLLAGAIGSAVTLTMLYAVPGLRAGDRPLTAEVVPSRR